MPRKREIQYKISVSQAKNLCDDPGSGLFVKKFKSVAFAGGKEVGSLHGYLYDVFAMMEYERLYLFDDEDTTERLFSTIFNGHPLNADDLGFENGMNENFLQFIKNNFDCKFQSFDNYDFDLADDPQDEPWVHHFRLNLGFVQNVTVNEEYMGEGIGQELMKSLRRFRNTVDFMMLQSFPRSAFDHIHGLDLTFQQKDEYKKTSEFKKILHEGQKKLDRFYEKEGYIPHHDGEFTWMVIDKKRLRQMAKDYGKKRESGPSFS